jgi:hypothetical protein
MIVLVSTLVFVGALVAMWAWVGYQRRYGHARKRRRS